MVKLAKKDRPTKKQKKFLKEIGSTLNPDGLTKNAIDNYIDYLGF